MKAAHTWTNKQREALRTKEAQLVEALRERDGISIEQNADMMDDIRHAAEQELAIQNMNSRFNILREVRVALQRIDDGSYGTCVECDGAINQPRLAAVPWAPRCVKCQAKADRNGQEEVNFSYGGHMQAA
jgi:DnaK suppressor protein